MELKIVEANFDTVIPACVMEAIADNEEIKRKRAEEARVAAIESNILKSGIIRKLNDLLREYGYINITLAWDDNSNNKNYLQWDCSTSNKENEIVKHVHNRELFDYIIEAYSKAGYKIGGHGHYSPGYWKVEARTIYAMADCNTCEV